MDKQQEDRGLLHETYYGFDIDSNVWTGKGTDGNQATVLSEDFQSGLERIHEFVDRVRKSDDVVAFRMVEREGRLVAVRTPLSRIPSGALVTQDFRRDYEPSEQVRVFLEAEEELRFHDELRFSDPLRQSRAHPGKLMGDVANQFVKLIRKKTSTKNFRRRLAKRRFAVEENFRRGKKLTDALFIRYSRLNVVRIDLSYRTEHRPTLWQIKKDFARLLNNARQNSIFETVKGFVWHLEHGFMTGFHVHLLIFLDGSDTRHDGFVAEQMGLYWENRITEGRGRFENCNFNKNRYKHLGIGMISHHDDQKRGVLVNYVLRYLTKLDEVARLRLAKGTKTFGTSQMPEPHPGTGRKRRLVSPTSFRPSDGGKYLPPALAIPHRIS